MKEDPENRTRWKHLWGWHNRGNLWDKMASRWAGEKNWISVRKKKNTPEEKRSEGPTAQLCGDSNVACKWINGEFVQGTKCKETIGKIQKTLYSWWKGGLAKQI